MRKFTDFESNSNGYKWQDAIVGGGYHPGKDDNTGSGNDDLGQPVYAPVDCEIVYSNYSEGWGNMMVGWMPSLGKWFRIAHLQNVRVFSGEKVKEGFQIAEIGNTGTRYAHLHRETIIKLLPYWTFYTSGMSKDDLLEYWEDPDKMFEEEQLPEIVQWNIDNDYITKWKKPYDDDQIQLGYLTKKIVDRLSDGE